MRRFSQRLKQKQKRNEDFMATPLTLDQLPLDILASVFNLLDELPADYDQKSSATSCSGKATLALHVPLVCRSFLYACKNAITIDIDLPAYWSLESRGRFGISAVGLMALTTRFRAVEGLHVANYSKLSGTDVEMVLSTMATSPHSQRALSTLKIGGHTGQLSADMSLKIVQAIGMFVNLLDLNLDNTKLTDEGVEKIATTCKSITDLSVSKCCNITDKAITFIGMLWPQLQHLDLSLNAEQFSSGSLKPIGAGCSNLEFVSFEGCWNIGDESLISLAEGCKHLTEVDMFQTDCTDDGIAALLRGCSNLDPDNIDSLDDLDHDQSEIKGDRTLIAIGDTRPDLTSFSLRESNHVTGIGLAALAAGCKKITSLLLHDCGQLTDADFATAVQNFPLVPFTELDLGYSDEWDGDDKRGDNYLIAIASVHGASVASVDDIDLVNLSDISDVGLSHIIRECTTAIASFENDIRPLIDEYQKAWNWDDPYYIIGDLSCAAIAERFPDVRDLYLNGCSTVTDVGLLAIANTCSSITDINLTSVDVTVAGLVALSEGCRNIEHFTGLFDGFTDADYAEIVRAFHFVPPEQLNLHDTSQEAHYDKEDTRGDMYLTALLSIHGPTFHSLDAITDLKEAFGYNLSDVGVSRIIQQCTLIVETFGDVDDLISTMSNDIFQDDRTRFDCFGDECASAVGSRFPDLTELNLANYHQVSDVGLTSLAGRCKNLTAATLSCESITSAGLQTLGRECTQIAALVLTGWSAFKDADWATIVCSFPSVAVDKMNLYPEDKECSADCRGDKYLAAIIATHGTSVTWGDGFLDPFLANVTETCLGQLVRAFTSMYTTIDEVRSLVHLKCQLAEQKVPKATPPIFGDILALAIIARFHDADELAFDFCEGLTDVALQSIAANCSSFTSIDLSNCTAITVAGIVSLGASCKQITSVRLVGNNLGLVSFANTDVAKIVRAFPAGTRLRIRNTRFGIRKW